MKLAVVGSRQGVSPTTVLEYLRGLNLIDTIIVSGGAPGVDTWAILSAQSLNLDYEEYKPDWSLGRYAGFIRNQQIVDNCDGVIAFWNGYSKGTLDTIFKAQEAGLPVTIVCNGKVEYLNPCTPWRPL